MVNKNEYNAEWAKNGRLFNVL